MSIAIVPRRPEPQSVTLADTTSLDAFGRVRVSTPTYVFDAQFTYDLHPLLFEPITNGSGAAVAHDATNRAALCTLSSTPTGGKAYLQTFEHFRYQPGRSQQIFITFNFVETKADTLKFAGYSDGANGIECQLSGSTLQFVLYSDTDNGDQLVTQANWNIDTLDGTGPSGLTLDVTTTQILVIDFQALYVGRVRVGFDIDGVFVAAHEFRHANVIVTPYIQTANLPIRCGMTCTGTVSTTMLMVCTSVLSEGGASDHLGYDFTFDMVQTAAMNARTHFLSIRPKTTFNSLANRIKFIAETVGITVIGANPVLWELVIGQAVTGASYAAANATYSGFEIDTTGTISGSPAVVIDSGYCASGASFKQALQQAVTLRTPISLNAAGAVRGLGTLSLLVTGYTGTSSTRMSLGWREIR